MTDIPNGPWVIVVGSHRSGTSALAGALGALGLNTSSPDDRVDWPESNPEHWESLSLSLHNEEILARFGGSWDAPPDLPDGWEDGDEAGSIPDPGGIVSAAYPMPGPSVWKDPRVALLLPYWRRLLPEPIAALLVWRSPRAVASSLLERDGRAIPEGLALWEVYNRRALVGLQGLDTFVIEYESLVRDPKVCIAAMVEWMGSLEQLRNVALRWDLESAAASVSTALQHQQSDGRQDGDLLPQQRALVDQLVTLEGGHRPLQLPLIGQESAWSTALIRNRRDSIRLGVELAIVRGEMADLRHELTTQLATQREQLTSTQGRLEHTLQHLAMTSESLDGALEHLAQVYDSTSWKVTKPLRQSASFLDRLRGQAGDS